MSHVLDLEKYGLADVPATKRVKALREILYREIPTRAREISDRAAKEVRPFSPADMAELQALQLDRKAALDELQKSFR